MRRVPAAELERLKAEIDLVELVKAKGVKLKWYGENMMGRCPFHDDRTPSLSVTPKKNLWKCMGACDKGGSVVDWVMTAQKVSFRHAVEILRSGEAASLLAAKPGATYREPVMASPVDMDANDKDLMRQVVDYYHQTLLTTTEAKTYLASRGLNDPAAIEKFKLGYANRTLGLRLPSAQKAEGAKIRARLFELGVYRKTGHEHLSGSLVVPIVASNGTVTEMYGRKVSKLLSSTTPPHLYLPGPHKGVWNPECFKSKEVILCEALLDALTFWVAGFKNVTSSYGTNGFTPDLLRAFVDAGVRKVFIAYDHDTAGESAAEKIARELGGEGMECWRVLFPKGMDANEYACNMRPADKALALCLKAAELMLKSGKRRGSSLAAKVQEALAPAPAADATPDAVPRSTNPLELAESDTDQDTLRKVVGHYQETLRHSKSAQEYLALREINHPEAIAKFRIGFADTARTLRMPPIHRAEGVAVRERLARLGVTRESAFETLLGSITIPIIDASGTVTQIYGRKVTKRSALREGTSEHTYLAGEACGVWNPECLKSQDVILCKGLVDALTFWVHGFRNVTASFGADGFTADHLAAFNAAGVKRVYVAYDQDAKSNTAAETLARELNGHGIEAWRVRFAPGVDANEYAKKMKPAAQALRVCLESAELMGEIAPTGGSSSLAAKAETALRSMIADEPVMVAVPEVAAEVPRAAAMPAPSWTEPTVDVPCEMRGDDLFIAFGEREYRVRGLAKNLTVETLRINLRVCFDLRFHVDQLDLYQSKARAAFICTASQELGLDADVLKRDLGRVLIKCETLQAESFEKRRAGPREAAPEMTPEEKAAAMKLLRSPDLLGRILADFDASGMVGEKTNKLVGYLAAVSRKLDEPLAIVIQSSSAAGKSSLMDAVLAMVPPEDCVKYSAMTGQSLFYIGETSLQHRILAIAEEEGANRASYSLKLLQSEKEIKIGATGKDPATGRIVTQDYCAKGPVQLLLTTTAIDIDEELMNRCLVLTVDEDREQTRLIHEKQRESRTLEALLSREAKARILRLHQNAQRCLRPLKVINDYATSLTFQDSRTRMRRDHKKYLTLIDAIALLHQHGRQVHEFVEAGGEVIEYIKVEPADIAKANELCHEILGRSLDELSPQTRRLLVAISSMVNDACRDGTKRADVRFTRKQVRDYCGWSEIQVRKHVRRLVEMEYVLAHRGTRGQQFVYELLYDGGGADGRPALAGLVDVNQLVSKSDAAQQRQKFEHPNCKFEHLNPKFEPPSIPLRAGFEQGVSCPEIVNSGSSQDEKAQNGEKTAHVGSACADTAPAVVVVREEVRRAAGSGDER